MTAVAIVEKATETLIPFKRTSVNSRRPICRRLAHKSPELTDCERWCCREGYLCDVVRQSAWIWSCKEPVDQGAVQLEGVVRANGKCFAVFSLPHSWCYFPICSGSFFYHLRTTISWYCFVLLCAERGKNGPSRVGLHVSYIANINNYAKKVFKKRYANETLSFRSLGEDSETQTKHVLATASPTNLLSIHRQRCN